jgi:hypothetical protein
LFKLVSQAFEGPAENLKKRRGEFMTNQQAFLIISAIIFGVVAVMHALRLALRWDVKVNQRDIPMWLSIGGLVVAAALFFWACWLLL